MRMWRTCNFIGAPRLGKLAPCIAAGIIVGCAVWMEHCGHGLTSRSLEPGDLLDLGASSGFFVFLWSNIDVDCLSHFWLPWDLDGEKMIEVRHTTGCLVSAHF